MRQPIRERLAGRFNLCRPCAASFVALAALAGCGRAKTPDEHGVYHVHPGESIQATLEVAAADPVHKLVRVHTGTYRPSRMGQALIWFNRRHDGVTLEADGNVVLTAANPDIADRQAPSFPAVVNHVVYFGDGVSRRTTLRGFKITGANNFVTTSEDPEPIQPDNGEPQLAKADFFYSDGGAIKVFGRSYPTIERVDVFDNYTSPCGGGVSVEQRGFHGEAAFLKDCIFRNNRCRITGSAVDVLPGSSVVIENCLFVGNVSNLGTDYVGLQSGGRPYNGEHGSGALTVFFDARAVVNRCTFSGNWNGADDKGEKNSYRACIFWKNDLPGGVCPGDRYELDILDGNEVRHCFLNGNISDLRGSLDSRENVLNAPDPDFDARYVPHSAVYEDVGYRP